MRSKTFGCAHRGMRPRRCSGRELGSPALFVSTVCPALQPEVLNKDPYGEGWMVVVRPSREDWRDRLVDGASVQPAFDAWIATGSYKDRSG